MLTLWVQLLELMKPVHPNHNSCDWVQRLEFMKPVPPNHNNCDSQIQKIIYIYIYGYSMVGYFGPLRLMVMNPFTLALGSTVFVKGTFCFCVGRVLLVLLLFHRFPTRMPPQQTEIPKLICAQPVTPSTHKKTHSKQERYFGT